MHRGYGNRNLFLVLGRPAEEPWPFDLRDTLSNNKVTKVERGESERALLNLFLTKISKIDPDIIVGHDISSYDLEVLLHRINHNKVPQWSRIGRLRRNNMPQMKVCIR